jgi:hypothetical protein
MCNSARNGVDLGEGAKIKRNSRRGMQELDSVHCTFLGGTHRDGRIDYPNRLVLFVLEAHADESLGVVCS